MLWSFWFIWNLPFAYRVETQFFGEVVFLFFKIFFSIATLKLFFFASVAVPCGEYCLEFGSLGC